jgi:hypothetical protein
MWVRQARGIDVKVDFQGLFGRLKNQIAGRAFCKVLGDLALDRRRQTAFEVIANQSDGFLAIHKIPLDPQWTMQFAGQMAARRMLF